MDTAETRHTEAAAIGGAAAADHGPSGVETSTTRSKQCCGFFPFAEDSVSGAKARQAPLEPGPIGRGRQVAVEASVVPFSLV